MNDRDKLKCRSNAKGYVASCSNRQVLGVIDSETQRITEHNDEGDIAEASHIMKQAAQREASKRGL